MVDSLKTIEYAYWLQHVWGQVIEMNWHLVLKLLLELNSQIPS